MSSGAPTFPEALLAPGQATGSSSESVNSLVREPARHGVKQNWILNPFQDTVFVIAAPLLALVAALGAFALWGGQRATAIIIATHVVFTVAHHLPTFIRIYGNVELFRRFQWSFVLGPLVPLAISIVVLAYINYKHYPVEYFPLSLHHAGAVGSMALPAPALRLHANLRSPQRRTAAARRAHGPGALRVMVRLHHAGERRLARRACSVTCDSARWLCR